ncbi:LptA/OstA family protein [uncultured Erythrobacter sp.]|uniref:LptA/OstA family protein n=1 Tax=uncultured Erythrobacter sp. TaxID=263913 RepID=UPI0026272A2F|nr:LptA/OstA family protein [uncultured Erythrobacter sp.]
MKKLATIAALWAVGGFALTAIVTSEMEAEAQAISAHNTNAPVTFDAGNIALDDRANRVVLTGGVVVNQSGLTVRSNRMLANYSDDGSLDIERITANGGVVVTRGNERASGDVAVYDFGRRIITMAGNVSLSRGGDTLSGGRLVIDLASGRSTVDGRSSGGTPGTEGSDGRVRGTFSVSGGE